MSASKKGLGKGLSALLGEVNIKDQKKNFVQLDKNQHFAQISDLNRNRYQPRINFDENKIKELSQSIKKNGLIQPIAVRKDKLEKNKYEIVAGERRWLAAQKAGLHEVPIVVLDLSDSQTLEVAIVENIQRQDLNIIEEAKGYQRLAKEFGYDQEKIAEFMSKSRSHISNTMRLLTLPADVVAMLEEGLLTAGQARPLIGLSNASGIAEEIISKKLSARDVENLTKKSKKPFKLSRQIDANVENIKNQLEDVLGLKVNIVNKKNNSGKVVIEYSNLEQFDLISKLLKQRQ